MDYKTTTFQNDRTNDTQIQLEIRHKIENDKPIKKRQGRVKRHKLINDTNIKKTTSGGTTSETLERHVYLKMTSQKHNSRNKNNE